ncbi:hypothetical protein FF1_000188 [Malus domestica]
MGMIQKGFCPDDNSYTELAQKMKFAGKFEVSNVFARWAEMMRKRVKRRDPIENGTMNLGYLTKIQDTQP